MAVTNSRNRRFPGLTKTANIIAITILIVASTLTFDWRLLVMGAAIELLYLLGYRFWPALSARYPAQFEPSPQSEGHGSEISNDSRLKRLTRYLSAAPSRPVVKRLDGLLLVVTVIGFVVIFFFGFGKHLLSHPLPNLTHAEGWETGAIIWTGFFLLYYTFKFPSTKVGILDKAFMFTIAWLTLPFLFLAWFFMDKPIIHVLFVWLIGVCFLVVDSLVIRYHPEKKEKDLSRASRKWADWPMVIAFAVLMAYLLWHRDTEHKDVFISGVVACQLLISNSVFVVMEFGFLQSAQSPALSGRIEDSSGAAIQGATLTAKSLNPNLSQTTTSDGEGGFHFLCLPVGTHEITVEASGFAKQSQPITLTAGQAANLRLRLTVEEVAQSVGPRVGE